MPGTPNEIEYRFAQIDYEVLSLFIRIAYGLYAYLHRNVAIRHCSPHTPDPVAPHPSSQALERHAIQSRQLRLHLRQECTRRYVNGHIDVQCYRKNIIQCQTSSVRHHSSRK